MPVKDDFRNDSLLTNDELAAVAHAVLLGHPEGASTEIVHRAMKWANQARVDGVLLGMVIAGEVTIRIPDGRSPSPVFELIKRPE